MSRERRRSTPLPSSANDAADNVDFRSATEAMQRAADAMIAATESFRKQFHQQGFNATEASPAVIITNTRASPPETERQHRRTSYQPYRPPSAADQAELPAAPATPPPAAAPFASVPAANGLQPGRPASRPVSAGGSVRSLGVPGNVSATAGNASATANTTTANPFSPSRTNPYYSIYRSTRTSTGQPAPPVSLHNPKHHLIHNPHLLHSANSTTVLPTGPVPAIPATAPAASVPATAHSANSSIASVGSANSSASHMSHVPLSQFYADASAASTRDASRDSNRSSNRTSNRTSNWSSNQSSHRNSNRGSNTSGATASIASVPPDRYRDDSGIAMAMSVSNPRLLQPHEVPGPLAMHPVFDPALRLQPRQQQQQQQQQHQQQHQHQQAVEADTNELAPHPSPSPTASISAAPFPPPPSTARAAQHTSWSLMPKIPPPTANAAPAMSRRLTSPDAYPVGASLGAASGAASGAATNGRRPSMSSYIDLIEAASRLKRTHSYQGSGHAGASIHHDADASMAPMTHGVDDGQVMGATGGMGEHGHGHEHDRDVGDEPVLEHEPEPILQIGRYTYVRSEDAASRGAGGDPEFRMSLVRDDGSRRYTASSGGAGGAPPPPPMGRHGPTGAPARADKKRNGPHGFSLTHECLFVLLVCLAQMLMLAGIAQALVPARIMGQSFPNTSAGNLAWYTAAYGLTAGTFVLPAGRLGDLFGHRRIFVVGFVWFGAWSLLAGFAPMVQLAAGRSSSSGTILFIVCRALQGIGPAMLVPNGQAMLGRAYAPGPRKNLVMSLLGASAPAGFVVGAAMSSLFAVYASWPWAFWTLAAVCIALAAVSMLVLPADTDVLARSEKVDVVDDDYDDDDVVQSKGKMTKEAAATVEDGLWERMDGMGILLGVAGLVLVNFAFNQAPIVGWATPYTYFLLILGLFFVAAFMYVEAFQAKHPLVPLSAMRSTTNFVLGCTAAGWGCFSVWVYYAVQMLENLRGWSPLKTSAAFAPAPVTGLVASLLTGFLFSRGVKPHWVMLTSMFAFFVGSLLFATSAPGQLYWANPFFSILIMPFGMDMSNPAATILLSNSVPRDHQGIAASLVVTFVNYAISLALGIAGSVEAAAYDPADLLAGYRAAQYFGLGLGGLGILFGTAFLCQSYLRSPAAESAGKA